MQKAINLMIALALATFFVGAGAEEINFADNWSDHPLFTVVSQSKTSIEIVFSTHQIVTEDILVDGITMQNYGVPGIFLSNDEGAPNIPGSGRFVAIPQGAQAQLTILGTRTEIRHNVLIAPAPNIPPESDDSPLRYVKNMAIYNRDAYYPESAVRLSESTQIRGVDAVMAGVSPMQYNPITKDLIIYKDIRFKIDFIGGNGRFGEDRLRSRFWEQILQGNLLNYESLPRIDFFASNRMVTENGYEYVIIVPNDSIFVAWADTIKNWRQLQGISTGVFRLAQIGGSDSASIRNFLHNAYDTWTHPPAAFLILSDFPSSGILTYGVTSPRISHPDVTNMASDNWYADFSNDGLPEIHIARICARSQANLSTMINKFLGYERRPYTSPGFYNTPLVACGWQTERWFQLCSEVIRGFFITGLGKNPARQYKIYQGTPTVGGQWSTATNTATVVTYWHNVGWLASTTNPNPSSWWNNGTASGITNAINSGAFLVQHRDHGAVEGWGEPSYDTTNLNGLDNSMLPYVFTTNCETGYFDNIRQSFTEKFHRLSGGAVGLNAATRISYSFVNDVFAWGMYDCMWPQFDPNYPTSNSLGYSNLRPCMANTYGKYYLQAHNWPYNPQHKLVTYNLFHHHGDAFMTLYAQPPSDLTVSHNPTVDPNQISFDVAANDSAIIALTVNGEILGVAEGTGALVTIGIPEPTAGDTMIVTVTKAGYRRYSAKVPVNSGGLNQLTTITLGANAEKSAISALRDSVICVFDNPGPNRFIKYIASYNGGGSWSPGIIGDTTISAGNADVIANDGKIGMAYRADLTPAETRFIWRNEFGSWSTPFALSEYEPSYSRPSLEYLGNDVFGIVYMTDSLPSKGIAFYDQVISGNRCEYILGDINGDGECLIGDVIYGVSYFKGFGQQPPDSCYLDSTRHYIYPAGDVNGNCEFRGSDLTRLVAYLKGHTTLRYCHWTPPPTRLLLRSYNPGKSLDKTR